MLYRFISSICLCNVKTVSFCPDQEAAAKQLVGRCSLLHINASEDSRLLIDSCQAKEKEEGEEGEEKEEEEEEEEEEKEEEEERKTDCTSLK